MGGGCRGPPASTFETSSRINPSTRFSLRALFVKSTLADNSREQKKLGTNGSFSPPPHVRDDLSIWPTVDPGCSSSQWSFTVEPRATVEFSAC